MTTLLKHLCVLPYESPLSDGYLPSQVAAKDKSALQAQVASLHKENLDLTRAKKILQAKVQVCLLND